MSSVEAFPSLILGGMRSGIWSHIRIKYALNFLLKYSMVFLDQSRPIQMFVHAWFNHVGEVTGKYNLQNNDTTLHQLWNWTSQLVHVKATKAELKSSLIQFMKNIPYQFAGCACDQITPSQLGGMCSMITQGQSHDATRETEGHSLNPQRKLWETRENTMDDVWTN